MMKFKKNKNTNLKPLIKSKNREMRTAALFIKLQYFLSENKISREERKVLARMLNAYYND
ncbi:hypothetical protein [Staphylococcus aureus]|uniref:hypothetical protein n=2 Tax=Staphylococcus aureus TaxID=1280 RepID=UPI003F174170